jgi:type II secretory ATPase GspE/PulE/Tfp pilus assembly ATPase PilB-like protein
MLVKEICKRCVNKYARQEYVRQNCKNCTWTARDENLWHEHYIVLCPYLEWDLVKIYTNVSELTHCPYQLEMVLKRSRDAK